MTDYSREILALVWRASLHVDCPLCGAYEGEPCSAKNGKPLTEPHARRIEAARVAGEWKA